MLTFQAGNYIFNTQSFPGNCGAVVVYNLSKKKINPLKSFNSNKKISKAIHKMLFDNRLRLVCCSDVVGGLWDKYCQEAGWIKGAMTRNEKTGHVIVFYSATLDMLRHHIEGTKDDE